MKRLRLTIVVACCIGYQNKHTAETIGSATSTWLTVDVDNNRAVRSMEPDNVHSTDAPTPPHWTLRKAFPISLISEIGADATLSGSSIRQVLKTVAALQPDACALQPFFLSRFPIIFSLVLTTPTIAQLFRSRLAK